MKDNALTYPARISASVYVLTLFSGIPRALPSICNILNEKFVYFKIYALEMKRSTAVKTKQYQYHEAIKFNFEMKEELGSNFLPLN